jgi:hypothetical protein
MRQSLDIATSGKIAAVASVERQIFGMIQKAALAYLKALS